MYVLHNVNVAWCYPPTFWLLKVFKFFSHCLFMTLSLTLVFCMENFVDCLKPFFGTIISFLYLLAYSKSIHFCVFVCVHVCVLSLYSQEDLRVLKCKLVLWSLDWLYWIEPHLFNSTRDSIYTYTCTCTYSYIPFIHWPFPQIVLSQDMNVRILAIIV